MKEEMETNDRCKKLKRSLWNNRLTYLMILSVILGCTCAIAVRRLVPPIPELQRKYLSFVGDVLIRLLKCTSLPLIISCIIAAVASLDLSVSRTIGWQFAVLLILTKVLSASVGLVAVLLIHPGKVEGVPSKRSGVAAESRGHMADVFLDMFRNMIPSNMINMYIQLHQTVLIPPENNYTVNDLWCWRVTNRNLQTMNLLGMIFLAIIAGACLNIIREKERGLLALTMEVYDVAMMLAMWVVWSAPIFLFFLVFSEIVQIEDFVIYFSTWGVFLVAVHAGFLVIIIIEYPLLLFFLAGVNPFKFYGTIMKPIIAGYVTSSSMATMPMAIDALLKIGVDERIVRFVVPIGININKDGAACRLVISIVFIAQMLGRQLSWGYYFTIAILSIMGSVIAPAVPFTTITVLVMLLSSLGFPQNLVAGMLAVEWIIDRGATACNVIGNCSFPKIIEKWNTKLLDGMRMELEYTSH